MFDIGWTEMLVIAVLAIVVIGPKDLPRVMRGLARIVAKMRALAREFQDGMNELAREAEIEDLKAKVTDMTRIDVDAAARHVIDPQRELDFDAAVSPPQPADADDASAPSATEAPPATSVPQPEVAPAEDEAPDEEAGKPDAGEEPDDPTAGTPPPAEDKTP